ncbi:hypothetical protein H072_3669 [Dactylellina haptotyla CBS 200.50]|uniref:Linoleate diol synthase n=1 Tax=Dactylellina haptotyla (strain CBS 200.50) TaxID=1284197 RepID=S8AMQ9_DACHA|nr:hypothetical protein H072_3669 [Dactylellina haptotyla CBS 200.50]
MSGRLTKEREHLNLNQALSRWTEYLTFPAAAPRSGPEPVANTLSVFSQAMGQLSRPSSPTQDPIPTGLLADLQQIGLGGAYRDMRTIVDVLKSKVVDGGVIDDKTYLMERIIQVASGLPPTSRNEKVLTGALLDKLWNQLQHPPLSYLGLKQQYRSADGSYNNILYPHLGKAGTPYARSVRPMKKMPGARPDPGLIFDVLLARQQPKQHDNKISSMLFYLATIIIHDLFRTNRKDYSISDTSSYLDLSPLYGSNEEEQKAMRTFQDGKIKPDAFSEKRLLGFPPGVCVLLISFGRYHNFIVEMLAKIDQDQRFSKQRTAEARDEKLFQTGRLITCGLYINIILIDYIRVILNLTRTESTWCLDPRAEIQKIFSANGTPQGVGNQVSAEFNLIYRWHSVISERDEQWTRELYKKLFGSDAADIPLPQFMAGLAKWEQTIPKDPGERTFEDLKRGPDGRFDDEKLVDILTSSMEDCANSYGANAVPTIMRAVEILGIEQSRAWELASLNEFRTFCGLKEHTTFEDINSDPKVANALRQLYGHPDYVEIYPGIVVEEPKTPMAPGAGLLPGYTISTAILSDAVALVRGDRFYTIDYTTGNLTNWGYNEVSTDTDIAYGGVAYKLFHRAFPGYFSSNSAYAMFPFTIPSENEAIYKGFGKDYKYDFTRPSKLNQSSAQSRTEALTGLPNIDTAAFLSQIRRCPDWQDFFTNSIRKITKEILDKNSSALNIATWVDAIRDVSNIVAVRATAELFSLPLTGIPGTPDAYTDYELHGTLCTISHFIDRVVPVPDAKGFELSEAATNFFDTLLAVTFTNNGDGSYTLKKGHGGPGSTDLSTLASEIRASISAQPKDALVTAAKFCVDISIGFTEVLRFILKPENAEQLTAIQAAGTSDSREALKAVLTALEASKIAKRTTASLDIPLKALTNMLQVFATLPNLRVAPGPQGKVHTVDIESVEADGSVTCGEAFISEDWGQLVAYPCALKVLYDSAPAEGGYA